MFDRLALSVSSAHASLGMADLKADASQIDQQMDAAREKADRAMDAAQTNLVSGLISGLASAGAGAASFTADKGDRAESASGLGGLARMVPPGGLHAGAASEIRHDAASKKADEADSQHAAAKDHRSRIRDAMSDLLQQLAQMGSSARLLG